MHQLKATYISMYMMALMGAMAYGIWSLVQGDAAGWGLLLATVPTLGLFMVLFTQRVARTEQNLYWIPGVGAAGTVLAVALGGMGLPAVVALIVGVPMALLYTHWYSRFGARQHPDLQPGQALPTFELQDIDGRTVTSTDLTTKPALWLFFRGNWCPLCMAQIKEVAAQYRQLAERGVEVLLISPQPQGHTQKLAQRFDAPMRFLTDVDNRAARRLGVLAEGGLPLGMQALGYDSDVPMPTVFITAPGGKVVYSDLTDNYRIRPEPDDFIAALDRAGL